MLGLLAFGVIGGTVFRTLRFLTSSVGRLSGRDFIAAGFFPDSQRALQAVILCS